MITPSFNTMRVNMVQSQLIPNKVFDLRLIQAFETIPRELFVPQNFANIAYRDGHIDINPGYFLLDSTNLARMIQTMAITLDNIVLVLACDRGYTASVIGQIAGAVLVVESNEEQAQQTTTLLSQTGANIADVVIGNPQDGYPSRAPYDAIVIAGMVDDVPQTILDQLANHGRLGTLIRSCPTLGEVSVIQHFGDVFAKQIICEAQAPMFPGFAQKPQFHF